MDEVAKLLHEAEMDPNQVKEMMDDKVFLVKAGVLRGLNTRQVMKDRLGAAVTKYLSKPGLLLAGFMDVLRRTYKLIDDGFLDELPDVVIFYTNKKTGKVLTRRGTSMVERANEGIQALKLFRHTRQHAHHLLIRKAFCISHYARCDVLGLDLVRVSSVCVMYV
jgi:hypothetical protein